MTPPLPTDRVETEVWSGRPASDPSWQDYANCRSADPDIFFGNYSRGARATYCQPCPVKEACLVFSLAGGDHYGSWGGLGGRAHANARSAARAALKAARAAEQDRP